MKIFLCEAIHQDAYEILKKNFEIINNLNDIYQCEIIINRNLIMDAHFIDQCHSLKLIVVHGTGYDHIDINHAKKKHIHLANTPHLNSLSVSELIITMMLELSRKTIQINHDYKQNLIHKIAPIQYLGCEISYKTFGIIGTGDIALKTAQILKNGFHMKIIAYSRSLTPQKAKKLGFEYCQSMNDVFKNADYISIGTSLTKETYHMITSEQLSLMKPSAYLINTARGAIIDEDALYEKLKNREIAGAGLDVLENEPLPAHHRLLSLDNVIYTPHIGGSTDEALKRIGMAVVDIIMEYKNDEMCDYFIF